jgi:hypothetical protein
VAEAWTASVDFDWRNGRQSSSRPAEDEDDEDADQLAWIAAKQAAKGQPNRRREDEGDTGRQVLDAMQPGRFWSANRPPRVHILFYYQLSNNFK